jgi:hypothetical protein
MSRGEVDRCWGCGDRLTGEPVDVGDAYGDGYLASIMFGLDMTAAVRRVRGWRKIAAGSMVSIDGTV